MQRFFVIDLLKLVAAQAIVLHHLSFYGPISDLLHAHGPQWAEPFTAYSRLAVQVFLVMGGFLAARHLQPNAPQAMLDQILRRYLRLIPPYLVALTLITLLVWCMRPHIDGDWLVEPPSWASAIAHALTLQTLLDQPALSAGAWYVAMDFQLYVLLLLLMTTCRRTHATTWAVLALAISSMWYFNRQTNLDDWPLYFFGYYGLGVLAAWRPRSRLHGELFVLGLWSAVLAFWWEPRSRLAVALATALLLAVSAGIPTPRNRLGLWMRRLSDASYGIFLTHFGVIVLVSAVWHAGQFDGLPWALGFAVFAWLLSSATGMAFHRWIERPLGRWLSRLRSLDAPSRSATHTLPPTPPWPSTGHTRQTSPKSH